MASEAPPGLPGVIVMLTISHVGQKETLSDVALACKFVPLQ